MSDVISRSELLKQFPINMENPLWHFTGIRAAIEAAPVVDAVSVVHARWIDEIEPNAVTSSGKEVHFFRCSACNFTWNNKTAVLNYFRFCPNCGARMDGETNDPH